MGLFGLITFDPFYKTNNTHIIHALAYGSCNMISDIHNVMQTEFDGKPSRSVRIIVNAACCTAANAFRNVDY